ncbi:MAG: hypothetical protein J5I50_00910 [Chitinophagaceae bacterium]|nr:hypothetical protein [Chitinophagaceae bacterium]
MFKKDNFIFGLVLGWIAPVIGFLIYKLIKFKLYTLEEMFHFLKENPNLITSYISVSLLANAVLFTVFINGRKDKTAKGIFVFTVIYAIIALIYKFW